MAAKPQNTVEIVKERIAKAKLRVALSEKLKAAVDGQTDLVKKMLNGKSELVLNSSQTRKIEEWKRIVLKKPEPMKGRRNNETRADDPTRQHDPAAFDIRILRINPADVENEEHRRTAAVAYGNVHKPHTGIRFQPANQVRPHGNSSHSPVGC